MNSLSTGAVLTLVALSIIPMCVSAQPRRAASAAETPQLLPASPREVCSAAPTGVGTAVQWLERASTRVMPVSVAGKVLRYRAVLEVPMWEQSDRMYEPFLPTAQDLVRWYDPSTAVEGRQASDRPVAPGQLPSQLTSADGDFFVRGSELFKFPRSGTQRPFNPWAVLSAWHARADEVRVIQRCNYRDYPRIVLSLGNDRLYLTEQDGIPIKLERTEPHYLWGQLRAEYLWLTWWSVQGGGMFPYATYLRYDDITYQRIGLAQGTPMRLVPADSAPRLDVSSAVAPPLPPGAPSGPVATSSSNVELADTVRVNEHTFLLVRPAYTETVTLQRDTVYLLDATTSEARSRGDSTWIASLFPGKHPVVVVVTDLAWPHISGVRFWVARGATIISHKISEDFIRRVVSRRWTLNPDALEKARGAKLSFRGVADSLTLAGGAIVIHAMRGNTTEGALAAWLPAERYLWAGDYLQRDPGSPYYIDVVLTARALALHPDKVGAQHMPLTNWADVERRVPGPSSAP